MGQEFIYAITPGIIPKPSDFKLRRRVSKLIKTQNSKKTASDEHDYQKENETVLDEKYYKKLKGNNIDSMA